MFKVSEYKARIAELEAQLSPEMRNAERLKQELGSLESQKANLSRLLELMEAKRKKLEAENGSLCIQIGEKTRELASLDDDALVQEFGLYKPRFEFADSTHYKEALAACRKEQKEAIKLFSKSADSTNWTVNGSAAKGRAMVRELSRLLMRAYNGECDEIVRKVKYANVQRSLEQISKVAEAINRNGKTVGVSIPLSYVKLKGKEVQLAFEFA